MKKRWDRACICCSQRMEKSFKCECVRPNNCEDKPLLYLKSRVMQTELWKSFKTSWSLDHNWNWNMQGRKVTKLADCSTKRCKSRSCRASWSKVPTKVSICSEWSMKDARNVSKDIIQSDWSAERSFCNRKPCTKSRRKSRHKSRSKPCKRLKLALKRCKSNNCSSRISKKQ